MKYFIASDIHGSSYYCRKMLEAFEREQADRLILLGDILYHGPRNNLPEGYDAKACIEMLNNFAAKNMPLCVRGNCDGEVDQMVLNFPIMAEYIMIDNGERTVVATHGHHYNEKTPLPLHHGEVLLCGHFHVPACREHEGYTYMNPGSVSLPKNGTPHGYMIWEGSKFEWKNIDGESYSPED